MIGNIISPEKQKQVPCIGTICPTNFSQTLRQQLPLQRFNSMHE